MAQRKEIVGKADDLYRRLKKQIILSELEPGQQLIELELAATEGCSQSTIREALLRLQEDGLIVRQGYRGTSVSIVTDIESQIFLELRVLLEVRASCLSLTDLTQDAVDALRNIVKEMEAAALNNDDYALFEKDLEFHTCLFKMASLPALLPVLMRCSMYTHRNKIAQSDKPRSLLETAQRHRNIMDAIETKNPDIVEEIVGHHISSIFGAKSLDGKRAVPGNVLTEQMRKILDVSIKTENFFVDLKTQSIDKIREHFSKAHEAWNQIDRSEFVIKSLQIPANPLSEHAHKLIPSTRITCKGLKSKGNILFLHNGGWVLGSTASSLGLLSRLAHATQCAVLSIDYALAPEFPFPCALNECLAAWRWLKQSNKKGEPCFVIGDSAGANLALSMMLDLRNVNESLPEAAVLIHGVYSDFRESESQTLFGQGEYGLSNKILTWSLDHYQVNEIPEFSRVRAFPAEALLDGLPPLLLISAAIDPLRDDSILLAKKLAQSDTAFEFKQYQGVVHGFLHASLPLPEAARGIQDIAHFIQNHFSD